MCLEMIATHSYYAFFLMSLQQHGEVPGCCLDDR
jgi:hypothetical protein